MFLGRWVYSKGDTSSSLFASPLWQQRRAEDASSSYSSTCFCGCLLFLKEDVRQFLQGNSDELLASRQAGDLLAALMHWADGGTKSTRAPSPFFTNSSGPLAVITRCVGDPCSFGVIAGFICSMTKNNSDNSNCNINNKNFDKDDVNDNRGSEGLVWEWGEIINCTTISQLSLYLDSRILPKSKETC